VGTSAVVMLVTKHCWIPWSVLFCCCIKKGGFGIVEVLDEKIYAEGDQVDNRKITSLVIKAVKE
jgi:hypothetical protein